jgi:hypothetical protein
VEQSYRATIVGGDRKDTAGIVVPPDVLAALGAGRRPRLKFTLLGYTYSTTVGSMGGLTLIPLSAEHRAACGLGDAETVDVVLAVDAEPPRVDLPTDLAAALDAAGVRAAFDALAPSHRKEWVRGHRRHR